MKYNLNLNDSTGVYIVHNEICDCMSAWYNILDTCQY